MFKSAFWGLIDCGYGNMMRVMQANENIAEYRVERQLPVAFSEDIAIRVLDIMASGKILPTAMLDVGLTSMDSSNFIKACARRPALAKAYAEARTAQATALVEQAIEISDNERDASRARNQIDIRKWAASKFDAKTFGDKLDLSIDQTVSIRAALDAAETRIVRPMRDLAHESDTQVIDLTAISEPASSDNESLSTPQTKDAASLTLDDLLG